ncbi:MAG: gamma-glutamyltransferase [Planctomycetota bacterium]
MIAFFRFNLCLLITALLAGPGFCQVSPGHIGTSERNMVASVHPLATDAGVNAFAKGGNAIDAAVATALTLGVVDGYNSGIGGGCFVLIHTADGEVVAIDGREMAPASAKRDMYLVDGVADGSLSRTGPLASGVPGALAALDQALTTYGTMELEEVIGPAAEIAENGFEVNDVYSGRMESAAEELRQWGSSLLKSDGSIYRPGEILRQPDLANTYRSIGENGIGWFYAGDFAEQTARWMSENGGILEKDDFTNYRTVSRAPVATDYRGYTIIGFPPPSSGGVHVAQILNILENFDLQEIRNRSEAEFRHVVAEAMKLAFADRAYWLGDPDFAKVPLGLVTEDYADELAARINQESSTPVESHGTPPDANSRFFERHTTHLCTADAEGNWVAVTLTVNTTFGSKVIVPGLGVVMNNQMDDFSIAPGVPNAFGLIGAEANAVNAGKRPLSSMSPTIVLKDGQPVMAVGAAGGPKIITQVVWAIINHIDLGMPVGEAIARPRVHHQWSPDRLLVETSLDDATTMNLENFGHTVTRSSTAGISQAISFDPETGIFTGAHDPRTPGKAAGQNQPCRW